MANGYRNGTGGVALTMSSVIHGSQWECVVNESIQIANKIDSIGFPTKLPQGSAILSVW
jgi:hypothetical protein